MDQKDSYAVVLVVMTHLALFLLFFKVVSVFCAMLASPLDTCSWVRCTQFEREVQWGVCVHSSIAEPTVMLFTVPLNGYTIVATAFIVTPCSSSAQP